MQDRQKILFKYIYVIENDSFILHVYKIFFLNSKFAKIFKINLFSFKVIHI